MTREEKEQWDIFMKTWVIPALKNTWGEKKCKEIVEALNEWEEQEPWIPVSERLPEPYQNILVTAEDFHFANEPVRYSVYQKSFSGNVDFIAWMPLPAPYESQERSDRE